MGFDRARDVILTATASTAEASAISDWLDTLPTTPEGEVLAASLAIDLLSDALVADDVARIVSRIDLGTTGPAVVEFNRVLSELALGGTLICASRLEAAPLDADTYVRTIELSSFVTYYLGPAYGYTTSAAHLEEVRTLFEILGEWAMGDIDKPFRGARGICWVAPFSELKDILAGSSAECTVAAALVDTLGLNISAASGAADAPELVIVRYPENFDKILGVPSKQPTSCDATWKPEDVCYISYRKDNGWGKTHSCSGEKDSVRERVHPTIMHLHDAFVASLIGASSPAIVMDRKKWRDTAFLRLDEAIATL